MAELSQDRDILLTKFRQLDDGQLKNEAASLLKLTARNIFRLALVIRVREERGHDLSDYPKPLISYLRGVADGRLLPEIIVRAADSPGTIRALAHRPIADQKKWLNGNLPIARKTERAVRPTVEKPDGDRLVHVDEIRGALIVTGVKVVIPLAELENIVRRLTSINRLWFCSACFESFTSNRKPVQCSKCGSADFELSPHGLVRK